MRVMVQAALLSLVPEQLPTLCMSPVQLAIGSLPNTVVDLDVACNIYYSNAGTMFALTYTPLVKRLISGLLQLAYAGATEKQDTNGLQKMLQSQRAHIEHEGRRQANRHVRRCSDASPFS